MDEFMKENAYVLRRVSHNFLWQPTENHKNSRSNPPPEEEWSKKALSVCQTKQSHKIETQRRTMSGAPVCRFVNEESNCWLKATLQSILHLQVVQDKLKHLEASSIVQMSSMPQHLAALIEVFLKTPAWAYIWWYNNQWLTPQSNSENLYMKNLFWKSCLQMWLACFIRWLLHALL